MARDSNGNWIARQPVVGGTVITSVWANDMVTSFGQDVTESLDRYGRGGMLAAFKVNDGSKTEPGLAFTSETNTGLRRENTGEVIMGVLSQNLMRWKHNEGAFAWNINTSMWEKILTAGSGLQVPVNPGTTDGDVLRWDGTDWVVGTGVTLTDTADLDIEGVLSVIGASTLGGVTLTGAFNGGGQILTAVADPVDPQDAVTKAYGDANYMGTGDEVPDSRTLTAGAGLTGGGDLSADRTFNVGAGTGVTVNANDVALDTTYADNRYALKSHTHAAADVVSGTFADARIPNLNASKITAGTFADARISQSSVTQHQAAINAGQVDGKSIAVVASLPGSPDANTIYFVTG